MREVRKGFKPADDMPVMHALHQVVLLRAAVFLPVHLVAPAVKAAPTVPTAMFGLGTRRSVGAESVPTSTASSAQGSPEKPAAAAPAGSSLHRAALRVNALSALTTTRTRRKSFFVATVDKRMPVTLCIKVTCPSARVVWRQAIPRRSITV
jgi:hypothetical protein